MMKNLNYKTHNACYHPYQQQQQQATALQLQQQQQHRPQQQLQLPLLPSYTQPYSQLQQQQQRQLVTHNHYNNQQLLRQQQPTHAAYQQQQLSQLQLSQSYGNNNNNSVANCFAARSNNVNCVNVNAHTNTPNTVDANTATAMAAMCQMHTFLSQPQQQQQQQQQLLEYNNNCNAQNNYPQQQQADTSAPSTTTNTSNDKFSMDASEIAQFLASELFMQQLTTFGDMGTTIQSVPTLTTPTLTPTTLRSIEETFLEITNETVNSPYQAGFKPPPLGPLGNVANNNMANMATGMNNNNNSIGQSLELVNLQRYNGSMAGSDSEDSNGSYGGQFNDDQSTTDTSSAATDSTGYQNGNILGNSNGCINNFTAALAANDSSGRMSAQTNSNSNTNTSNSATPAPRRGGGRRPTRAANMSPEEEEKRRVRRERNKLAAARCRKRRVDQTNELTEEVEALQKKGETMRKEIEMLNATKNQLEFVLQAHRTTCQKITEDMLTVATSNGLIRPAAQLSAGSCSNSSSHHNNNSNDSSNGTITGLDATLNSTGRSNSPLDLKPVIFNDQLLQHIKPEPLDCALDSNSSLDQDGPSLPKRFAAQPLPNISTLTAAIRTPTGGPSGSLNTLIVTTAPVNFANFPSSITSPTLNALNKVPKTRPNTLPVQRPFGSQMHLNVDGKAPPTQIQGVPIQTPSTGTFNFDSLMDGGTGLTPVSGPLVPNCSSQNKHPLELPTPTTESSKLVSL